MTKRMCWHKQELWYSDGQGWKHYSSHPLRAPELPERNASKGYPTMQRLRSLGYEIVNESEMNSYGTN